MTRIANWLPGVLACIASTFLWAATDSPSMPGPLTDCTNRLLKPVARPSGAFSSPLIASPMKARISDSQIGATLSAPEGSTVRWTVLRSVTDVTGVAANSLPKFSVDNIGTTYAFRANHALLVNSVLVRATLISADGEVVELCRTPLRQKAARDDAVLSAFFSTTQTDVTRAQP